jgi:hypothetical protein
MPCAVLSFFYVSSSLDTNRLSDGSAGCNGSTHSNPFCSQFVETAICITTDLLLQMEAQEALFFA